LSQELSHKLNEIKINVLRRFKHQRFVELNEELKKVDKKRDKKSYVFLNSEIRALKYNPNVDGDNILNVEEIESKVKSLIEELEEREQNMIGEEDTINSTLCELNVINLINFLKHFKVEMNYYQFSNKTNNEFTLNFSERCNLLENNLKLKVYLFDYTILINIFEFMN